MRAVSTFSPRKLEQLSRAAQAVYSPHLSSRPLATMADAQAQAPAKLHGRAFYKSIGSPKMILAPMVEQSEFVRQSRPCSWHDNC